MSKENARHVIHVKGIELYAFHGCLPEEGLVGTKYHVNVTVECDFSESFKTDELSDTVDYVVIFNIAKEEMAIRSKLIEHVAYRIKKRILEVYPSVYSTLVEVVKFNPPMNGNVHAVSVVV